MKEMQDIVLVTIDSLRYDFIEEMKHLSSNEVYKGTAAGHYTRPSLASLISGQYLSAVESKPTSPTIAEQLSTEGYTCIGVSPTPQTDASFGFDSGFEHFETYYDSGSRGKEYREFFAQFNIIRRLYHRIRPPQAKLTNVPKDVDVLKKAVGQFNKADSPRFLWVHTSGAHRPYGRGDKGISESLDRKALFSPKRLTDDEHGEIISKYRSALERTDRAIEEFRSNLGGDPLFVVTSDHGDEFGEENRYFHQPQRRRVAEALIEVPVVTDGIKVTGDDPWFSLIDIAPTIFSAADLNIPEEWDGIDHTNADSVRDHALTIAPWHDEATVSYKTPQVKLVADNSRVSLQSMGETASVQQSKVPKEVEQKLRDLGYVG